MRNCLAALLLSSSVLYAYPDYGCGNYFAILGDWTMMKRGMLHSKTIVKNGTKEVIETSDFIHDFDYEPGYRLGFYYRPNICDTMEILYFYPGIFEASEHASNPGNLSFPFKDPTYSFDFTNADKAHAQYST